MRNARNKLVDLSDKVEGDTQDRQKKKKKKNFQIWKYDIYKDFYIQSCK